MARSVAPAVRSLALLALLASASAWTGSTMVVSGPASAERSPVLLFAPASHASGAKLPVVLLLHSRCQNSLGADADFHFANLVDQARGHAAAAAGSCSTGTQNGAMHFCSAHAS